jgi:hypothetical protein
MYPTVPWSQNTRVFFQFYFYYHIVVVLGVHCDILKSAYNISWLNSPLSIILLYPPLPFLEYLQQVSSYYFHT